MSISIFVRFDPVHVFKNIRNSWLNIKDSKKTIWCPEFQFCFDQSEEILMNRAEFSKVRQLQRVEELDTLRLAHNLTLMFENVKSNPKEIIKKSISMLSKLEVEDSSIMHKMQLIICQI